MCYDINKRKDLNNITVGELISALSQMPSDATMACCGDSHMYLHVADDESGVCIDYDGLDAFYLSE